MKNDKNSLSKASLREARKNAQLRRKRMYQIGFGSIAVVILAYFGWTRINGGGPRDISVDLSHVHGLGFSSEGEQLIVPAHDGLRVYSAGGWQIPPGPRHDYMGYSPVNEGFYSSGHPAAGFSGMVNPMGLIKSVDGGQNLIQLGFQGESDFHLMAVGYFNHAVYVFNGSPNSRLSTGLFYTLDDGQTWSQSALGGITQQPFQLAAHPVEANMVALATQGGLFLSVDFGDSFVRLGEPTPVTAVTFAPDGEELLFGAAQLAVFDLATSLVTPLNTPGLDVQDAINYIAVNPVRPDELAIATRGIDLYLSTNRGASWQQIAVKGSG